MKISLLWKVISALVFAIRLALFLIFFASLYLTLPFLVSLIEVVILTVYVLIFKLAVVGVASFFTNILYITASIFGIAVIIVKNPVHSLLCLIAVFFHAILFLLALKVEFLSLIFLIIYIGAIAILFLFVIMMFNLRDLTSVISTKFNTTYHLVLSIVAALPVVKLYFLIEQNLTVVSFSQIATSKMALLKSLNAYSFITYKFNDIFIFSNLFYTYYAFLFILSSFILFVAMIGAIVLALTSAKNTEDFS